MNTKQMAALILMCASSAMATTPQAKAAVPLSDNDGEFSYKRPQKKQKAQNQPKKGLKKMQISVPNFKQRTEIGFYALGGSGIEASNEYAEASYRFAPGFSIGAGSSMSAPKDFYFGLINIHSEKKVIGLRPSVHIGYAGYAIDPDFQINDDDSDRDSGVLCGLRLEYQLNPYASVDLVMRRVSSGVEVGHDVHSMSSMGVRFYL